MQGVNSSGWKKKVDKKMVDMFIAALFTIAKLWNQLGVHKQVSG
jgi:hypothetical protein